MEVRVGEAFGVYQHAYTHFKVTLHAFYCRLTDGEPRRWRPASWPGCSWLSWGVPDGQD